MDLATLTHKVCMYVAMFTKILCILPLFLMHNLVLVLVFMEVAFFHFIWHYTFLVIKIIHLA